MLPLAYTPSAQSIAHRSRIANVLSSLRPLKPRVSFWKLAAHLVPTLWTLYRGLLRNAPSENIRWRVASYFRCKQHLTSPAETRKALMTAQKLLRSIELAQGGDPHLQSVLRRYDSLIVAKGKKERIKDFLRDEWAWRARLRKRPILTGTYVRPTIFNKPLPRLVPQPDHITMMIKRRRRAHDHRGEKYTELTTWRSAMRLERSFETSLARYCGSRGQDVPWEYRHPDWEQHISDRQAAIRDTFNLEQARARSSFPSTLIKQLHEGRRQRLLNKTRELRRERSGEVLPRTLRRRRQMPPPPVLVKMTPKEKRDDRIVRSVSEVGFVGKIKKLKGFKLRDPNAWKVEDGLHLDDGHLRELRYMERYIRQENENRRASGEMAEDNPGSRD